MRLATALTVASHYGFTLPTPKMVDAIYEQSTAHLAPEPLPPGDQMRSTEYYWRHTQIIRQQEAALGMPLGTLTAGDKKDLVLTNRLWQNLARIAIYGWHRLDLSPIQPLVTVHGARYTDYSHGVRLISNVVFIDGEPRSIFDVLADTELAWALSREGPTRNISELLSVLEVPPVEAAATPPFGSTAASGGSPGTMAETAH